ncbi:GNAT family N-acetyltransferase [Saccharopolyspora griseoalba]|uniref:GNAT family N-acetyltransferase n=1 Tax=Saccharopolyspora griseoalba TaxID=1431848 RepID=A0ABW2LGA0_9PSEU
MLEPACPADVRPLHRLRRQLENWLHGRGIDQWRPGEVPEQEIAEQVARGDWHVLRRGGTIDAALRHLRTDPQIWGEDPAPAAYVHGLMVDRAAAGRGLGDTLLRWAAERGRAGGAELLRLDCAESNTALRAYYRARGFTEVGRKDFEHGWFSATLLEKRL